MLRYRKSEKCTLSEQHEEKMEYLDKGNRECDSSPLMKSLSQSDNKNLLPTPYARRPLGTECTYVEEIDQVKETNIVTTDSPNNYEQELEVIDEEEVKCDLFDLHGIQGVINVQADRLVRKAHEQKENAGRIVRTTITTTKTWVVCNFNHLPKWLQDNEFLHFSHRPQLYSFKECFQSIFRLHSETGNIWTHLIGCLMFLVMAFYVVLTLPQHMLLMDKTMFGIFFLGAILCLGFSFLYHTVSCHSPKVGKLFSKLDYVGISLLITGSFISCVYYMFYCDTESRFVYLVAISGLCLASVIVSLWEKFSEPNFRTIRASVFIVFGCSGIVPALHWFLSVDWKTVQSLSISFIYLISMGILYILGALLYAGRIPERFFPGKCDYWFQSHQIFHILVIVAAVLHYQGISEMAAYRLSYTCDAKIIEYPTET